ncbi:AzlD domain-containing protein [Streptococcus ratti]|uniref:AzlD domain-containing protein n=3 Tax=Bacteria TaxID=2 RepID=A0A7X9QGK9_STRRT|nr:AzlD domain-containing protein [Streptococcus ratti]VEI60717.1 branched-chain amino acid transport protein [Streptococcus mutans]EJN94433.1 hypothetical protein SRA_07846 [Streptococcus ratti FA-1 = DSM 20564]EMP70420.1 branched-chain amino acid transport protein [Streptococcus ratti FA-1 = DSM 20564]NMD48819.1 AzlD domain-containing protein [Streptococcus ratti]QEY06373.1 AzlD domain-containing protein [Streptococcus ratti]
MSLDSYVLTAVLLGFVVSWLPRIAPFILVKYKGLPDIVVRFLKYLPVSILFALTFSSLLSEKIGSLPQVHWLEVLASLPTFYIAYKSKNLLYAVLTGIAAMAVIRLLF